MSLPDKAEVSIESKFKSKKMELQIIKYLLTAEPGLCTGIEDKWFSIQPLQDILSIIKKLKVCLTRETLLRELQKSGAFKVGKSGESLKSVYDHYVDEVFKVSLTSVNTSSMRILIKQLYELYDSRNILIEMKNIIKNIDSFNVDKVKQKFKELSRDNFQSEDDVTGNYLDDYEARLKIIEAKATEEDFLIPTGIAKLDHQIGGVTFGEFGTIIGRTGLGKTAMLISMCMHAWMMCGFNCAFATGEMRNVPIQFRMDSNVAHIEGSKFRTGRFTNDDFKLWEAKIEGLREIQSAFLEIGSFSRNFNTDNLEDWLNRIQDKHGKQVHIIFVDYINIMDAVKNKKDRSEWQSQANAVWDFKTLIETFNDGKLAGWTAGQVKDEFIAADKLTLGAAKYARAIEETSPIICGILRTDDDILYNTMQLVMLKMRNATVPRDPIILHPDLNFMRINDKGKSRIKSLYDLERVETPKENKSANKKRGPKV